MAITYDVNIKLCPSCGQDNFLLFTGYEQNDDVVYADISSGTVTNVTVNSSSPSQATRSVTDITCKYCHVMLISIKTDL